ncbi:hypothetical protein [Corallococcus carmarthensis]|uniref:Uncharacterized protein n=1 Tax=Corallococcus carmarthensis TaxID=2316728 RepID=A0A3A8JQ92_9BACT|nr:hypothetical protein [Corallococcus carmarthensis]NOK20072.1 hypothetical protein [Corallococcus carmarthensis]RKG97937.1 hypothetical protein D7X32_31185 [Corallococcus carmarthensis]
MKLPLMASMTALLLGGCATQTSSLPQESPSEAFASDEMSWDSDESPRTQEMQRTHDLNFYGQVGAEAQAAAEASGGTGIQPSSKPEDFQCVDLDEVGTGGSGSIDMRDVDNLAPEAVPSQNQGARLDIIPEAWNRNKGIGTSPVAPSTGTPPAEGSGGAGH